MDNDQIHTTCIEMISRLLTPRELEKLAQALGAIKGGDGWGDLLVRFKAGRMDTIEITSSILVRDKNN